MLLLSAVSATLLTGITIAFWWLVGDRQRRARQFDEQRRLSALGEMSAVMAHEIRNPLASLKGHSQLLRERLPAGSSEHGKATRIVGDVERLQTLVDGLLDFTRSGPLDRRATNPAALVEQTLRELGDPRIELRRESAPAVWSLDGPRFRQVVGNLLENALQADSEGGKVTVELAARGGRLVLTVRDRGPGLPEGEGDRLFEPFVTTRAQGTGLGLAVVRRVVEMHGGTVTARNHPEGGAEFRVKIPR